jgi:hypothetical protein
MIVSDIAAKYKRMVRGVARSKYKMASCVHDPSLYTNVASCHLEGSLSYPRLTTRCRSLREGIRIPEQSDLPDIRK